MDPVTQTLTGALFTQAVMMPRLGRIAAALGAAGGVLADADVFLGPWTDPSLPFELHRHFTHALVFIPVGGAIAAAPFLLFSRWRRQVGAVLAATTIGYATHGLLDNLTSYGTHLLWPFTHERTAWDAMSIIDPIYTGLLLVGVLAALLRGMAAPARVAALLALAYVGLGFAQHHRAAGVQERMAEARGHGMEHRRVMPTLGNLLVRRSVYEHNGRMYADAIRIVPFGGAAVRSGVSVERFDAGDLPAESTDAERVRDVFVRFSAFADGFTANATPGAGPRIAIGDMRYSFDSSGFSPIWGLGIDPNDPVDPTAYVSFEPQRPDALRQMWLDIVEPGPGFRPVGEVEASVRRRSGAPGRKIRKTSP